MSKTPPRKIPLNRIWTWIVPPSAAGGRADTKIPQAIEEGEGHWEPGILTPQDRPACSRSRLQKLMDEGQVKVDDFPAKANLKLRPGSKVQATFPTPKSMDVLPEDRPLEILFEDEHLAVINKPPGLTVHPSETQTEGTLVNILLHRLKNLSGIGGTLRPGIVHRIDKNTSGALVITKNDQAHQRLADTFSRHEIDRLYLALCYGSPAPGCSLERPIRIEGNIGRNPKDRKKMAILEVGGRRAISWVSKREEYSAKQKGAKPFASFLEVRLETGRTHQIRVHLTSIQHSILGDPTYGEPTAQQSKWIALPEDVRLAMSALPGQALHAAILGFAHPITGERLRFEAKPPAGFTKLLTALRNHRVL